jgi:hypothetical protein
VAEVVEQVRMVLLQVAALVVAVTAQPVVQQFHLLLERQTLVVAVAVVVVPIQVFM